MAGRVERCQVGARHVTGNQRPQADQHQRREGGDAQHHLHARRLQDAPVLDREGRQQHRGAHHEGGVHPQRQAAPLMKPRSIRVICQVLMAASGANRIDRMQPAASPEPIASTGDQASQLHHTEGASILL